MSQPSWAPEGIDLSRPSIARVYDYYLGGFHNFEVDREMGARAVEFMPELPAVIRANRDFMGRAVSHLAGNGIRQFLDVGSGIPTVGNVHTIAHEIAPDARIVYVDIDPVAVAHSRAILNGDQRTAVIHGDLRRPREILEHPAVTELLDLSQPVALLMVAVLHFISDDEDPAGVVQTFWEALAPGSRLVISHADHDDRNQSTRSVQALYQQATAPMIMRSRDEVLKIFGQFEPDDVGLVGLYEWGRQTFADGESPPYSPGYAGVGRKR